MSPDNIANAIAAISALAACIGGIYAVRAFLLSRRAAQAETEAARPNFAFINFGLERPNVAHALSSSTELLDPTAARISGTIKNIGRRPARNIRTMVLVLRQIAPDKWGTIPFPTAIADDVQPNSEWLMESPTLRLLHPDFKGIDIEDYYDPGFYVFIGAAYDDATTARHYRQQSWLRWPGIKDGVISSALVAANADEKTTLLKTHRSALQDYL